MTHKNKLSVSFLGMLFLFIGFQVALYVFIFRFNHVVPFQKENYQKNFHHYLSDPRIQGKQFDFLRALGPSDAQWYLKIANEGYPYKPGNIDMGDKKTMNGLMYAFFPLYPLLVSAINKLVNNIELAAFIFSNVLLIANFWSLYYVGSRLFNKKTAYKTIFLLFAFPFSIFYRSYFTEGVLLISTIWFAWFVIQKQWLRAAVILGLMNIVKSNGFLLNAYLFYLIWHEWRQKKVTRRTLILYVISMVVPFLIWMGYCYIQTGNPFYFLYVRSGWYAPTIPIFTLIYNAFMVLMFPMLPLHGFHFSKIDTFTMCFVLFLLIKSRKTIDKRLWWIALCLWLAPLMTTDTMSFTRYQTTSFPLFLYGAQKLQNNVRYGMVLLVSYIGLGVVALLFVNWYWIG